MSRALIPKEQLSAFQRWEMASFDPPPPAPHDPVQNLSAELRAAAHAQGLAAGHEEGRAAGFESGFQEGLQRGQTQAHAAAEQLRALAGTFVDALRGADDEIAETLTTLAFDIAKQVVRQNVTLDPTMLLGVAREVLESEPALAGAPHLIVNPADLAVIEAYLKEELEGAGWSIRTDPAIERGGCRAKSATGEIDATLGTRWQRVAHAMGRTSPW
jgi:flagellar assembly protein FliH